MKLRMSKLVLYIATSQDGFIADKKGGVDWLPAPDDPKYTDPTDALGYKALMSRISRIVMGSRSYEQIWGFGNWAWSDKETFVFTSRSLVSPRKDIHFVNEEIKSFIDRLEDEDSNGDIWLLGGAELTKSFAKKKLIDECIITIIPVDLGEGIKLELPYEDFRISKVSTCMNGIVQKHYVLNQ